MDNTTSCSARKSARCSALSARLRTVSLRAWAARQTEPFGLSELRARFGLTQDAAAAAASRLAKRGVLVRLRHGVYQGTGFKVCALCGACYDAKQWQLLAPVGVQGKYMRGEPREVVELRNCACSRTLARDVTSAFTAAR